MNPEKGPENVNPDNSDFETKEVANVFNENTTNEFAPLPQDPSEILKDVREFLKPINERLKQLKKEFKVLRGLFQSAYQNSKPTEKLASELESNKKTGGLPSSLAKSLKKDGPDNYSGGNHREAIHRSPSSGELAALFGFSVLSPWSFNG